MRLRGFRGRKLPEATFELITEFIENQYETLKQKKKYEVWSILKNMCDKRGVIAPSYKNFCARGRAAGRIPSDLETEGPPCGLRRRTILLAA
jgi:hypothetical protein